MANILVFAISVLASLVAAAQEPMLKVASKEFTESLILSEILRLGLMQEGEDQVFHYRGLGGTRLLWNALKSGEIDAYPDYTGTIVHEILGDRKISDFTTLKTKLEKLGISISAPLGFNNSYALAARPQLKRSLGIERISDLRQHPSLRLGFTHEFMDRQDGWKGLRIAYGLQGNVQITGLEHDLSYRGLRAGSLDIVDAYTTDPDVAYFGLEMLEDDQGFFPDYTAVYLVRSDRWERFEGFFKRVEGTVSAEKIRSLNARVKFDKAAITDVAAGFLSSLYGQRIEAKALEWPQRLMSYTKDHLVLVAISLSFAILIALPLGIMAAKLLWLRQPILTLVGILQTIPSLALLVFMIPFFGIGTLPALFALFLYSLLPIVRNTCQGLVDIPPALTHASLAMGLSSRFRLFRIELPMAASSIVAGIKTSAVINVGTATLGALVGAGGYGQPILSGIRLDDVQLILLGSIPAALMAILVQVLFEVIEHKFLPRRY